MLFPSKLETAIVSFLAEFPARQHSKTYPNAMAEHVKVTLNFLRVFAAESAVPDGKKNKSFTKTSTFRKGLSTQEAIIMSQISKNIVLEPKVAFPPVPGSWTSVARASPVQNVPIAGVAQAPQNVPIADATQAPPEVPNVDAAQAPQHVAPKVPIVSAPQTPQDVPFDTRSVSEQGMLTHYMIKKQIMKIQLYILHTKINNILRFPFDSGHAGGYYCNEL